MREHAPQGRKRADVTARHRPRIATRDAKRARLLDATRAAERPVDAQMLGEDDCEDGAA